MRDMINPCTACVKMHPELLDNFEYGCDKPCQIAKDYYSNLGHRLDELLTRVNKLLDKTNE